MAKLSGGNGSEAKNNGKTKKKKNKSGPNAAAMKQKAPKANPFETIWSRRKFDIIGKKRKGEELRIGLARSQAIEKRKKTLLKEYERSGKASVFVDKRIGEQNEELGEFDKAILRSQRERQTKLKKKNMYNLSDGEEEDDFETQGLGLFSGKDDFEDEMPPDEDDDDDTGKPVLNKQLNAHNSQNQFEVADGGEEKKHKSKKEVMQEIIQKSKFYKGQKAMDKEENEELVEELDKKFASLAQSGALLSLTDPGKIRALKALVNQNIPKDHSTKDDLSTAKVTYNEEKPDSYDKLVKELSLEMRARPSDRTKTPEEIAQEERERLERLEEERKKRMLAAEDASDEDNEGDDGPSAQKPRFVSGDDLGDSFSVDEEPKNKRGWVDEVLERKNDEDSENEGTDSADSLENDEDDGEGSYEDDEGEESDEDDADEGPNEEIIANETNLSLKDWEQSDDDDVIHTESEEEEEEEGQMNNADSSKGMQAKKAGNSDVDKTTKRDKSHGDPNKLEADAKGPSKLELPYIIEAPKNLEEFSSLVENFSNSDKMLIINRIRASNAIKLAAENRKKMQVFYGVLMQYFAILANKKPLKLELLNFLVKPLMEMSLEIPYFAAICARQRILHTRSQLCESIRNQETSSWPSSKMLFLLRLWSMIFPCSDFRHVVMTPAILLMCEYLMRCPITSGRDIAIGSFLCSMLLAVTRQSRKFCPEAIVFLRTLLKASIDGRPISHQDSQFSFQVKLKELGPLLRLQSCIDEIFPLDFLTIMEMTEQDSYFNSDHFRTCLLATVVDTLAGFVAVYEGLSCFPETFSPISCLLLELGQQENMPHMLQDKCKAVAGQIKSKVDEQQLLRRPLQMRKQKPVPIRMLTPKFEENYVKGRDYDPDRERAERRKLQKLIKREAKGAARELRKDNHFLFEVKQKEKVQQEEERAEKYGKALAFLQEQEHAFKSGQLGKGSKRRR